MDDGRLSDEPGIADATICDYLNGLDRVITIHNRLINAGRKEEAEPFYPDNIYIYVSLQDLNNAWDTQDYTLVRQICVEEWIKYVPSIAGDYPYFTSYEFLDGTAQKYFN